MGNVIDLEHIKRGQRLLAICLRQFGTEYFFVDDALIPRIDHMSIEDTVTLACSWISRRTDRDVTQATRELYRDMLKRHLVERAVRIATARGL